MPDAPIVLIHGLIGDLKATEIQTQLGQENVLAPDLLGYGSLANVPIADITIPSQIEHVRKLIETRYPRQGVYIVGHSVGGVIALLLAYNYPDMVLGLISVEGNFTLKDAFWSASIAQMNQSEVETILNGFQADPAKWLDGDGIPPKPEYLPTAKRWLTNQPTSTVQAMAASVVQTTSGSEYMEQLREVFTNIPVHLVAGQRSRSSWDVPDWALRKSKSFTTVPGGHLMMLEDPIGFGRTLKALIDRP